MLEWNIDEFTFIKVINFFTIKLVITAPLQPVDFRCEHSHLIRLVFSAFFVYAKPSFNNFKPPRLPVINSIALTYEFQQQYCSFNVATIAYTRPKTWFSPGPERVHSTVLHTGLAVTPYSLAWPIN